MVCDNLDILLVPLYNLGWEIDLQYFAHAGDFSQSLIHWIAADPWSNFNHTWKIAVLFLITLNNLCHPWSLGDNFSLIELHRSVKEAFVDMKWNS